MALQLMQLPFTRDRLLPEEVELRDAILAAYRMLMALCSEFPQVNAM
jgi:hypothetical protein